MKCLISFSSHGRENYNEAMLNLIKSTKGIWDGDYLLYSFDGYVDEYVGVKINQCRSIQYPQPDAFVCSPHSEIPYHFKPALFQIAKEKGYKQVIWCDSTIRMLKHPKELLEYAKEHGVCAFNNLGYPLKNWIHDTAVNELNIHNELGNMKQIMACVIIFDFENPKANAIFDEWVLKSHLFKNGESSREGFMAHRHDQAILSAILHKYNVPLIEYGALVYPPHHETKEYGDNIYFLNKGIN